MTQSLRDRNRRSLLRAGLATAGIASFPGLLRAADPIRIGFLGPVSGPLAFVGQTNQNCLALAVDEINAAGGIGGRKLEVIAEDTQMSTKVALDKARKLYGNDRVEVITGLVLPSEREAALSVAAAERKLVLYPNFDEGRCHPNLLTTGLAANQSIVPAVGWLVKNVGKTGYALVSDIGTNREQTVPILKTSLERQGGKFLEALYFPFGTRDFGPALQQVKAADPAFVWHSIGDDPITLVKQYKSFGMKPQLITSIMHESIAAATDGDAVGALSVESYFMSIDNPANRKFLSSYTARYKEFVKGRFVRGNAVVLPHGERTYVAIKVWAEAVRLAGSTDLDKVRSALSRVEVAVPRGVVKVHVPTGHLLCESQIGRVQPDNAVEPVARFGVIEPQCAKS